jgi:GntR family transcriptional regulator
MAGKSGRRPRSEDEGLVYLKAEQFVLEMIEGPDYSPGDRISSERELSERFGISRMTMRKAIDRLVKQRVLERRGTSGTYISTPVIERPFDDAVSHSISEIVERSGGVAGSKLLFFESAQATDRVAERLAITAGARLIVIRRLRTVNDLPFCVETSHLPADRVPGLAADDLLGGQSLYAILKQRYDIDIGAGESTIAVAPATAQEASLLGLRPETPTLMYRSVVYDRQSRPIEYLTSVNHPHLVVFKTEHAERKPSERRK